MVSRADKEIKDMTDFSAFSKRIRLRVLELCDHKRTRTSASLFQSQMLSALLYGGKNEKPNKNLVHIYLIRCHAKVSSKLVAL